MPDDKRGREKKARDADRRQRERDVAAELERWDETEPPVDESALGELDAELDALTYPATGSDVVAAFGDREVDSGEGTRAVEELVPDADAETFDSPEAVRRRVRRPTVAEAMKRVVEASEDVRDEEIAGSKRTAYEKTFRALAAIDADDDDEGVRVVADWIVERIREEGRLPDSRAVRKRAAKFCRKHGYEVGNDQWLGV